MTKRRASSGPEESCQATKRPRLTTGLLTLSDEILIRILRYLSLPNLLLCERISRRFQSVAGDSQLWRPLYHERFVQPRLEKARKISSRRAPADVLPNTRSSRWLDDDGLVRPGNRTHWKGQYKLRHNWTKGSCDVTEIPVANRPPTPPILAKLHRGIVFTADTIGGLRAFPYRSTGKAVAPFELSDNSIPTCLDIDNNDDDSSSIQLVVGFDDGTLILFLYSAEHGTFRQLHRHEISKVDPLTSVAFTYPYVLTMTESHVLVLEKLSHLKSLPDDGQYSAERVTTLQSHNAWPPTALSLRQSSSTLIVSVAYSIPTYTAGWSAGIQELVLSSDGHVQHTRLATAMEQGLVLSQPQESPSGVGAAPTYISYSHPYLLVSHSDNTMMLYLVNSGSNALSISPGRRLWGHTSGIFGADIGKRGRAVSVSSSGEELRVWELEGSLTAASRRHRSGSELSVQVTPSNKRSPLEMISNALGQGGDGLALALENMGEESAVLRGWVGFDEENVVVLRERVSGCQSLAIYDFR